MSRFGRKRRVRGQRPRGRLEAIARGDGPKKSGRACSSSSIRNETDKEVTYLSRQRKDRRAARPRGGSSRSHDAAPRYPGKAPETSMDDFWRCSETREPSPAERNGMTSGTDVISASGRRALEKSLNGSGSHVKALGDSRFPATCVGFRFAGRSASSGRRSELT